MTRSRPRSTPFRRTLTRVRRHRVTKRVAAVLGRLRVLAPLVADRILVGLAVLATALLVTFASLVGSTGPQSSGTQMPYSQLQQMVKQRQVASATLLDVDHRMIVTGRDGAVHWVAMPSSPTAGDQMVRALSEPAATATVTIDAQNGKQTRRFVGQVLLPILILVALFAFFMRLGQSSDNGGLGAFSRWKGGRPSSTRPRRRGSSTAPAPAPPSPSCVSCVSCCATP